MLCFEQSQEDFGSKIYAFDPTPISPEWLKSQKLHPQFQAFSLGIVAYDDVAKFGPPPHEG